MAGEAQNQLCALGQIRVEWRTAYGPAAQPRSFPIPQFIDLPTERTCAGTDLLLAIVALACLIYLVRLRRAPFKTQVWAAAFGLLTFAAAMGAVAHGFKMSAQLNRILWMPLNLALGLAIGMFVVGVVYDQWGQAAARRVLPILLGVGVAFFLVTVLIPGSFTVFILYEAVAMLFALAVYVLVAARGPLPGAWWMVAGVAITIAAAGIQALGVTRFTALGCEFDHNGAFHLIQIAGVLVLTNGLRLALLAKQ